MVKNVGERLPRCSTASFHKIEDCIPEALREALVPLMGYIKQQTEAIKNYDRKIAALCKEEFPETSSLQQVAGVGPLTALGFVLVIESPDAFPRTRTVGAYLGLCPRKHQSGRGDPQLRISKAGDPMLRRLLVSASQYILGPFGPDTDLKRLGLSLATRGGKNGKKRAVVAVARRLAVLLLALWKSGETYEPLRLAEQRVAAA